MTLNPLISTRLLTLPLPVYRVSISAVLVGLLAACGGGSPAADAASVAAPLGATSTALAAADRAGADASKAAAAPGFYVDALLGKDSNPGSIEQPWATLSRASGMSLQAGQGLYLRCGRIWRESLELGANQLVDGSVVAGYGVECATQKAVISGADDFSSGWTLSGNVWSRSLSPNTPKISQLFVNGQALRTAQWPNAPTDGTVQRARAASVLKSPLLTTSRINQDLVLESTDSATPVGTDLIGATVQLRTQSWLIESRRVTKQSGSSIQLDAATDWNLQTGQGLVLQDKLWMLDGLGEFFHDTVTQRLYLIAPTSAASFDLNSATVEGSVRDVALALSQRTSLDIRDLALRAARIDGLRVTNAPQAQLSRLEASDNLDAGIRLAQWAPLAASVPGPTISDSLVSGNGQYGLDALHVDKVQVKRVRAFATGTGFQHQAHAAAAIAVGNGARVESNVVDDAAYIGIRFGSLGGSVVAGNTVTRFCRRLADCGGIYTWTGRALASRTTTFVVENNRIVGSGLLGMLTDDDDIVAGIYIDDFSNGARVRGNVVHDTHFSVFVHNASNVQVDGNRLWLPTKAAIAAIMDQAGGDWMSGNSYTNNELVPLVVASVESGKLPAFKVSQAVWFQHAQAGEAALAIGKNTFSGNQVVQLQGSLQAHAWLRLPTGDRYVDATKWRVLNPLDGAVRRPALFAPLNLELGPELVGDASFANGLATWGHYNDPAGHGFSLQALAAAPGCANACMRLTSGTPVDLLGSQTFQMRPNAVHVYRWSAAMPATAGATVGAPYIGRASTPWDVMSDERGFVGYLRRGGQAGEVVDYESFFVAKSNVAARINIQLETLRTPVTFKHASVREVVGATPARNADWVALASAPPDAGRTVGCADLGWPAGCSVIGLDGTAMALPLTLPAGTDRLVLRADSNFRR